MKKLIAAFLVMGCALLMNVQSGSAYDTMEKCFACHDFSGGVGLHTNVGHIAAGCTACHVTVGDNSTTPKTCATCHPAGNPGECGLVNKHSTSNCTSCHDDCTSSCPAAKMLGADDPGLAKLRDFRDNVLANSALGQKIISSYYNNADAINAALEENPKLKAFTFKALQSFIPVLDLLL